MYILFLSIESITVELKVLVKASQHEKNDIIFLGLHLFFSVNVGK